jgi:type II restriction enzyme
MNLAMTGQLALPYKSASQRARVVTESWGEHNLFCPNCTSPKLTRLQHNAKANDFACPICKFWYQLKGQQTRIGNSIPDGAYETMVQAIQNGETPNFYFMHYDLATWRIRNLLLIPHFAFPKSAIIKRKPLAATARRAGWIGCNISLSHIPVEARIVVVEENVASPEDEVRAKFRRVKPLGQLAIKERGWTLDVLTAIRTLGKNEFTNEDAYTLVPHLEQQHPGNRHVRDKIRQRLQVLRDAGLLIHVERGRWRIP